ncbi:GMC family oxidoreductase N-terminal domain-containing protein [Sphingobium sp. Sx8-8]|uniref:GMC family oxidoreductase n=1 Tax=Sphingobium sp. Sx8-8 TaxID=2933617 RepID=UPI001F57355C|nr:GMC family oxidoreductase N-terminal domain-containing protein [Sphingobium sp. Sx8-8]
MSQYDEMSQFERFEMLNRTEVALMRGRATRRTFLHAAAAAGVTTVAALAMAEHAEASAARQSGNRKNLRNVYDFIVCGGGSGGCAVARRLAENPAANVLLIEAGGSDEIVEVTDGTIWFKSMGSERDWSFKGQPAPTLNGRTPPFPMGKILGGGSSINGLVWARGHKNDYDSWAAETGNTAWSYENVLNIYRRIEDWDGPPNPRYRGKGGVVKVGLPQAPINPVAPAMIEASRAFGMPTPVDLNAETMEGEGGAGMPNLIVRDGRRVSMAAAYIHPYMDRPNLTILLHTEVRRLVLKGRRAAGVEIVRDGKPQVINAAAEVILSTGAINTPKILMLSGIGPEAELKRLGIPVVQKLEGVGQNFQDHILLGGCMWESPVPVPGRNNSAEYTHFWKSDPALPTPDMQPFLEEFPYTSEVTRKQYDIPPNCWVLAAAIVRPTSRGHLTLASANPADPPLIYPNFLSTEQDMKALRRSVEICRELGNSAALKPYARREIMPGPLMGEEMDRFMRNAAGTYFHETCTAKMGRDAMSVVDGSLKVYGIDGLRIADGSVMPAITTGNTMAPCVIIGERCAEEIKNTHRI